MVIDKNKVLNGFKVFSLISQFSFAIVTPIILLAILGNFLQTKFNLPFWAVGILVFLGIFLGFYNGFIIIKRVIKLSEKEKLKKNEENKE